MSDDVVPQTISINGRNLPAVLTVQKKGKSAGKAFLIVTDPLDGKDSFNGDQKVSEVLSRVRVLCELVGVENFDRVFFADVIRAASNHASKESRSDDNSIVGDKYGPAFINYFGRETQRISEINEEIENIQKENGPLFTKVMAGNCTPEERIMALRVHADLQRLMNKKAEKDAASDKRRASKAKTATVKS